MTSIQWVTAFVDMPADSFERGTTFWERVTGWSRSATRGATDEFATLVPPDGRPVLKVQRIEDGPARVHLDLHVDDRPAAAVRAVDLGATLLADPSPREQGYVVMESPGGLVFCLVDHAADGSRPQPIDSGAGPTLLDQVCIDAAPDRYEVEAAFWTAFTGWERIQHGRSEYEHILGERMPLRFLMQRREDGDGERVVAHFDVAAGGHIDATAARHLELGATFDHQGDAWTTLRDPAGLPYCLVGREPSAGS